ncbi:hypothetical protein C8R45DRAFT_936863 [Mycena sanguinolenta]|nr:hypothetical protein C8R45DRAFT_936863 [Mycena sanguinolenta]
MRYSIIFSTLLGVLTCALGLPHNTREPNGLSTRVSNLFVAFTCALGMPYTTSQEEAPSTPVSDHSNDFYWVDAVSMTGKPFQIGYPTDATEYLEKRAKYTQSALMAPAYRVNWPLYTNQAVDNVPQLIEYDLSDSDFPGFDYALAVKLTNTGWGADYLFCDPSPDCYSLSAFTNGWHTVRYKSSNPTIVQVETSQEF